MSRDSSAVDTSYLNRRLAEVGITDQLNTFERVWTDKVTSRNEDGSLKTEAVQNRKLYKLFDADKDGNILIRYFNLDGQPYRWRKAGTKQPRDFIRIRLKEPRDDAKYIQPEGSPQFPFFPPAILRKYKDAEPITTLYLVEGEFKAFVGSIHGLDIVGIAGIHGFYDPEVKRQLHDDLKKLLVHCRVEKIVLLFDADILSLTWSPDKDLYKRPSSFYSAIKSFRESLQLLLDDKEVALEHAFFMHIRSDLAYEAKGLDDLFVTYTACHVEILEDLRQFQFAKKYFKGFIINDLNRDVRGSVFRYLGLADEQEFYKTYEKFIGTREFIFNHRRYIFNGERNRVELVRHEDVVKFMRIGTDWVKKITQPNKYGEPEEEIVPWRVAEIQRDYKQYPGFLEQIPKYDGFCNEPAWDDTYKEVHHNCLNLSHPLRWRPADGPFPTTVRFLKHIFQGKGEVVMDEQGRFESEQAILGDSFTVALDYLTILLRFPKQKLPVLILVSPENETGKTTFLKFLRIIFGTNMCTINIDQFNSRFNAHFITKFIIAIDEAAIKIDRRVEKERLKMLVTSDEAFLEFKGMDLRRVSFHGKVIICSNEADSVLKIDQGESRWFVVRVPVPEQKDPDLELKLKDEVEAFLFFLRNRSILHPRRNRLWFEPEWIITDQFNAIVNATKDRIDRVFEDWMRDQFKLYRLQKLQYSISHLLSIFNEGNASKYRVDKTELKAYLKRRNVASEKHAQRFKSPVSLDIPENDFADATIKFIEVNPTFPYTFYMEDWLTSEEMEEAKPFSDPETGKYYRKPSQSVRHDLATREKLPF